MATQRRRAAGRLPDAGADAGRGRPGQVQDRPRPARQAGRGRLRGRRHRGRRADRQDGHQQARPGRGRSGGPLSPMPENLSSERTLDDWSVAKLDLTPTCPDRLHRPARRDRGDADGDVPGASARDPVRELRRLPARRVAVDLESIQDKIVFRGRGGYCYEQAQLFGAVLERLGFTVDRMLARVGPDGGPARRAHPPHAPGPVGHRRLAGRPGLRLVPARPAVDGPVPLRRPAGGRRLDLRDHPGRGERQRGLEAARVPGGRVGHPAPLGPGADPPDQRGPVQPLHVHPPGFVVRLAADPDPPRPRRDPVDPRPVLLDRPPRPRQGAPRPDRRRIRRRPHRRVRPEAHHRRASHPGSRPRSAPSE